jgi:hypothetical protein
LHVPLDNPEPLLDVPASLKIPAELHDFALGTRHTDDILNLLELQRVEAFEALP